MAFRRLRKKDVFNFLKDIQRYQGTDAAALPELDEDIRAKIESNELKPRKHPGVRKLTTCALPENITRAAKIITQEHPVKVLLEDARTLTNYLFSRHYPWEEEDLIEKRQKFKEDVTSRLGELPEDASEEQVVHYHSLVTSAVSRLMTKYCYQWSALELQDYTSVVYMVTRAAPNYAAVMRVFWEITRACPDYRPTTLFDFGSGIGSVSWAAKTCWGDSVKEYMNIESCGSMSEMAEVLLKEGNEEADTPPGVYYRAFLPAQQKKYSVVVSAHSLMELPSRDSRLQTLLNLWHKTRDFLVIIEQGTKPGFKVVAEARDFVLGLATEKSPAHVFAPCPHDGPCPRQSFGPYPCHFQVLYIDVPICDKQIIKKELLSFVIIKRGTREGCDWPRVVRPILSRSNHVICRMCTTHGDLREIIFTKNKHGRVLYKCAKMSNWGDRLPVNLPPPSEDPAPPSDDPQPPTTPHSAQDSPPHQPEQS